MVSRAFIFITVISLLTASCKRQVTGKGEVVTDERTVGDFQTIEIRGTGNVVVTYGDVRKVSVSGYENLVPLVETSAKNGKLTVTTGDKVSFTHSNIKIEITTPAVKEASLSGAGSMEINSFRHSMLKIDLRGAGNVRFANSECDTVYATVSGAGNMQVNVTSYLEATINGVGNIEYAGDPTVKSKVSGVGNVKKK